MRDYKLYFLNEVGRVCRAQDLEARDDLHAFELAKIIAANKQWELWDRARVIASYRLPPASQVEPPEV
jgi:hypothetical protein